ncbi:MAG: acyl-protein synthetase, partial [Vulcanimicrobiaceae bacterium]
QIPAVPAQAYKEATIATFDPARAALTFETSGTTGSAGGLHFMETAELYDRSLVAAFDRFVLGDGARLRYLNLVPDPRERPGSSLGYMMDRVARDRGSGETGWFVTSDALLFDDFASAVGSAVSAGEAVCVAATAFALVHVTDEMEARELRWTLPPGSRVMETGGFKGRARVVSRDELYDRVAHRFGLAREAILAEYGMTELASQYYDDPLRLREAPRRKVAPPWLRSRAVNAAGSTLPAGTVGALVHVDLANRSSCVAIATEDLGAVYTDGSIVLVGREAGAALRGCSLDAETLRGIAL